MPLREVIRSRKAAAETTRLLIELWSQNDYMRQLVQEQASYPRQVEVIQPRRGW